ncbi:hypothetical protein PIB30_085123 [Stylosanthes scabra]|uniref:Uncharacterized protein n=1 Tax=Stylosanthes scabra TaxID=79078 RepID=A0ABU6QSA7_9FABA|nr:hypothetical protein [Stylosanthes scabra]
MSTRRQMSNMKLNKRAIKSALRGVEKPILAPSHQPWFMLSELPLQCDQFGFKCHFTSFWVLFSIGIKLPIFSRNHQVLDEVKNYSQRRNHSDFWPVRHQQRWKKTEGLFTSEGSCLIRDLHVRLPMHLCLHSHCHSVNLPALPAAPVASMAVSSIPSVVSQAATGTGLSLVLVVNGGPVTNFGPVGDPKQNVLFGPLVSFIDPTNCLQQEGYEPTGLGRHRVGGEGRTLLQSAITLLPCCFPPHRAIAVSRRGQPGPRRLVASPFVALLPPFHRLQGYRLPTWARDLPGHAGAPPERTPPQFSLPWTDDSEETQSRPTTASCAPQRTPPRQTGPIFYRVQGDGFTGSSSSSKAPATPESDTLTLSVASRVSGLQSDLRKLGHIVLQQDEAISDIRRGITKITQLLPRQREFPSCVNTCCSCRCGCKHRFEHVRTEDNNSGCKASLGDTDKSKKQRRAPNNKRNDYDYDPTYVPSVDVEFSVDHMPFRNTRAKQRSRFDKYSHKAKPAIPHYKLVDLIADCIPQMNRVAPNCGAHSGYWPPKQHNVECRKVPTHSNGDPNHHTTFAPSEVRIPKVAVAAYLFSDELLKSEILVDNGFVTLDRRRIMSLAPKQEVEDDVLDVLVSMLSVKGREQQWYMPTTIMQAVLEGRGLSPGTMQRIKEKYMRSKVDKVTRALQLESITLDSDWLSVPNAKRPRFGSFDFEVASVPRQVRGSNDCRVWVAQWMVREVLWANFGLKVVNKETRMRIAVDLVMKEHNPLASTVVSNALAYWQEKIKKSVVHVS